MNNYKYIGKRLPRKDSLSRVTGEAKFVTDISRKNMLYGKLLLSEKPHADFTLDVEEALEVEGIHSILTYKDLPDTKYNCMEWFTGIQGTRDETLLCDRARFVGDRLALVLGNTKQSVEDAIKKIKVNYEELPVITSIDEAKKDEFIIKGDSNLNFTKDISCGDADKGFEEADYIVEDWGSTPKTHHLAIENHSALSEIDDFGNLLIISACQVAFAVQMHMSRILGIPYSKIRVIKANMGGSFGGKQQPLLELIAGACAWKLKRPILIYMDREQSIIGTFTRTAMKMRVKTGVKKDGTIVARRIETYADGGAYATNNSSVVSAFAKKLFRLYRIYNQQFHGEAYYTNKIPTGACRAYGGPQAHALSEINMTNVANAIGMDPCELRLKNLIEPFDDDPVGGPNLGKAAIKDCVRKGMEEFDWKNKFKNIHKKNTDRYAYGVGMACCSHGNGYLGAFPDFTNLEVVLNADNSFLIKMGLHEQGCGTLDTICLMASEAFDTDPKNITLIEADTFITPYDAAGTQASRVTFVAGGAVKEAGEVMIAKILNTVSKVKDIEISKLYTDCGKVKVKDSDEEFSYGEVATMSEHKLHEPLSIYIHHKPAANPAALAAFFVEVKVDKKTGLVEIQDALAAHDIGKAVNPMLVEGQIQGGSQFSLGLGLCEEIEIESSGKVKSKSLSKYHVLNSQDMPDVKIILVESEDETAPYGVKSVGEVSAVAPAPAVLNAINHALGTNITDYPANPERIVASLEKLRKE